MRANIILGICGLFCALAGVVAPASPGHATAAGSSLLIAVTRYADAAAVARIRAGAVDCRSCNLAGADLSHTCVKNGDLTGARFDNVKALYMCMSYANFTNVSFRHADLTGANLGHANLSGADLTGTVLDIVSLKGADLSNARGLTQAQIDTACTDGETKLPSGLKGHTCS